MIVAGEASGDAQAARLVAAMAAADSSLRFYGVAGEQMKAAGVEALAPTSELSIMGLGEVLSGLRRVLGAWHKLKKELVGDGKPDLLVLVDFPDFNLRLARVAARNQVPVFYYVSPQVWAWRKRRIKSIARRVDRMVVLFPFEVELYAEVGLDAHYVGHPLAETVKADRDRKQTRERYGLSNDKQLVALLPGSRVKEVEELLPVMLEAARGLSEKTQFVVARAPGLPAELLESMLAQSGLDVPVVEGDTYNLVAAADAVALSSGTATVECAVLGCPMVVMYRVTRFTYAIVKRLVKVPWIAMPNILLDREAVPELVQGQATAEALAATLAPLLEEGQPRSDMKRDLASVSDMLVKPGAAGRAAALAVEMIA